MFTAMPVFRRPRRLPDSASATENKWTKSSDKRPHRRVGTNFSCTGEASVTRHSREHCNSRLHLIPLIFCCVHHSSDFSVAGKKCPFLFGNLDNTWFMEPIRVIYPNGISIGSAVCFTHERNQQICRTFLLLRTLLILKNVLLKQKSAEAEIKSDRTMGKTGGHRGLRTPAHRAKMPEKNYY